MVWQQGDDMQLDIFLQIRLYYDNTINLKTMGVIFQSTEACSHHMWCVCPGRPHDSDQAQTQGPMKPYHHAISGTREPNWFFIVYVVLYISIYTIHDLSRLQHEDWSCHYHIICQFCSFWPSHCSHTFFIARCCYFHEDSKTKSCEMHSL